MASGFAPVGCHGGGAGGAQGGGGWRGEGPRSRKQAAMWYVGKCCALFVPREKVFGLFATCIVQCVWVCVCVSVHMTRVY